MIEKTIPERLKRLADPNLYNLHNPPPSASLDTWPGDMSIFDKLKREEVPRPFDVLQDIADKHLDMPIGYECERDGDSETERDKWHPERPSFASLARAVGITPQYLSAMMNDRAPVGLKFAKTLYAYCRKELDFRTLAWKLRVSYEFWGARGKHNPDRTQMGGSRDALPTVRNLELKRETFLRKQMADLKEFDRRQEKERLGLNGLKTRGVEKGRFVSRMK